MHIFSSLVNSYFFLYLACRKFSLVALFFPWWWRKNYFIQRVHTKKCHDIYQARAGTTSKWSKISLPSELDGVSGYHVKCYKSYTAFTLTKSSSSLMVEVTSAACIIIFNYSNHIFHLKIPILISFKVAIARP